jgi:diadenosine tetraphosphate (Ap4A) HIT family hydrolase
MTTPPAPATRTAIHALVERCRADALPARVARVPAGWVVLGERQVRAGYCLLLPDPVVADLNALEPAARTQFLLDMSRVGDALLACTGALRINYAIFGNLEPALHAHVIPRFANEPEHERTQQPWALDWSGAAPYEEGRDGPLKARLAQALAAAPRVAPGR